jgi:hypothetical protein
MSSRNQRESRDREMPLFGYTRASIGTGLSVKFSQLVRVEMTYIVPLSRSNQDHLKAFQLDVGLLRTNVCVVKSQ